MLPSEEKSWLVFDFSYAFKMIENPSSESMSDRQEISTVQNLFPNLPELKEDDTTNATLQ